MEIANVDALAITIPLLRTHRLASFTIKIGYFVIVKLETDEGLTGYGEVSLSIAPVFPEETYQGSLSMVKDHFGPHLIGKDPFHVEAIMRLLDRLATRNFATKAAIEFALFDLMGKALNRPVVDLMGGIYRETIPLSWSLATGDPEMDAKEAKAKVTKGHRIFKVKTGFLSPDKDIERLMTIRQAVGDEVDIRIDVNQGWTPEIAITTIKRIEDAGVNPTFVEQPVIAGDFDGMARIAKAVDTPIMADEGLFTLQDALRLIEIGGADIFSLKMAKHGGYTRSKQIAALAEAANIPCYVGGNLETGLASLACAHFAASTAIVRYGCELFGPLLFEDDILAEPIDYSGGVIRVPTGPGLGAQLDHEKIEKYRLM